MSSEWVTKALDKFILLQRGHDLPADQRVKGDIPVAGSQGITGFHNESIGIVPGLTIGRSGSIGATQFFKSKYYPLNTTLYATDFLGNDPLYSYYFFKNFDFSPYNSGSVQPSLNRNFLYTADVDIPPLHEQKAIAHILETLDSKIELNRKTNETLESIAKALFKSWFVDFDPVTAKAEGQTTGLPDEISELFPGSFEDSELGEIPSGWSWQSLGDLTTLDKGVSYKGAFLSEKEGVPMVNLGCFAGAGKFREEKMKFYMGDYKDRHLASSGDIFVANTDMTQNRVILGSPVLMPRWKGHEKYLFSHHVFALRLSAETSVWSGFIYHSLLRPEFRQIASGYATGTTVLALPKDGILEFTIPKAPIQLIHSFNSIFQPIAERIESAFEINRTLNELRDALLPRLISGELRVPDAEKMLEEAGV